MRREPLKTKAGQHQEIDDGKSTIAPVKGWNARDPDAAMKEGYAKYLENMVPTGTEVRLRSGVSSHATGFGAAVKTLMAYQSAAGVGKLFAANNSGIFDATSAGAIGATVMALTDGWCSHINFRTSSSSYLFVANGVDTVKTYDGTTWASVASWSINGGGTLTSSDVINFCMHQRRLWLVKKDSADAYYFDVNAVAGNVTLFPLGGYMSKGGFILAAYTWTLDGGAGPEDLIAFVTSEGQVIVYAGTDPASTTGEWLLRGSYNMPAPLGRRCGYKLGGDLLLLTEGGVYSLSSIVSGKAVTQDLAMSDLIRPEMTAAARAYSGKRGWQLAGLLSQNILFVNVPTAEASASYQYGMNTTSRGWWKNVGWSAFCFEEFNSQLYAGFDTKVGKALDGALDFAANVTGYARGHYDYCGERTREKFWQLVRPLVKVTSGISLSIGLDVDFSSTLDFGGTTFGSFGADFFDAGEWDEAVWGWDETPVLDWFTPGAKSGYCAAVRLRAVSNGGTFSWSVTDLVYERGARVVG